mmetsp:Transcript_13727/g.20913  ORF Transcript_13727/g.20913 Transcript_13727/m.20913 type:complete len:536 (+) Transcript_13727:43-1650(+)
MTESATPGNKPKGLPGFLRRSLRTPNANSDDDGIMTSKSTSQIRTTSTPAVESFLEEDELAENTLRRHSEPKALTFEDDDFSGEVREKENGRKDAPQPLQPPSKAPDETAETRAPSSGEKINNHSEEPKQQQPDQSEIKPSKLRRQRSYKERQFESCLDSPVISLTELRQLCWNGIPRYHRAQAWKLLLGYLPTNQQRHSILLKRKRAEYEDSIAQHYDIDDDIRTLQEQETLRQVLVDVPRTAPDVALFRQDRIRAALSRLLYIWACRHPASSYVQGINDLATPFIVVFVREQLYRAEVLSMDDDGEYISDDENDPDYEHSHDAVLEGTLLHHVSDEGMLEIEADCYWCLTNLLAGIQDHYTSDQPGVQRMVMRLEELVTRIDASLSTHLANTGITFVQFAFKWMNCLLLREFSLSPCVERLWDTYLSENGLSSPSSSSLRTGDEYGKRTSITSTTSNNSFQEFHVYVCAAFLCQFSSQLQGMTEFEDIFAFLQTMPTQDWGVVEMEVLLSQAYVLSTLFQGSDAHLANTELIR